LYNGNEGETRIIRVELMIVCCW